MKEFTYTIKEPVGIHARPAGMLAKEAKAHESTVTIVDKNVNGLSVDPESSAVDFVFVTAKD